MWLSDHLFSPGGNHSNPDLPLDTLVLATAIGATTKRIRLAWATLNLTLRPPALMAKSLISLDQITHGRVIAALGSGWNKPEWEVYNMPIVDRPPTIIPKTINTREPYLSRNMPTGSAKIAMMIALRVRTPEVAVRLSPKSSLMGMKKKLNA